MTAAVLLDEAESVARVLTESVPGLVVATWGSTARGESTPSSDLDLMCWNPQGAPLPRASVRQADYLDLVGCEGNAARLRAWATTNATDLHALMFSEVIDGDPRLIPAFDTTVAALWQDAHLRAREVCHLLGTSINLPEVHGTSLYRPEKFALGATRCWTALAECGALIHGRDAHHATEPVLTSLAARGMVDPRAPDAFETAMRLRLRCESGEAGHLEQSGSYAELASVFLLSVRRLMETNRHWLARHTGMDDATLRRLVLELAGTRPEEPAPEAADPARPVSETEAMLRVFLAGSPQHVRTALRTPHRASWWLRHAALMNPYTDAPALRQTVRYSLQRRRWWADRNLFLYAIRHPHASHGLLDDITRSGYPLRPMDREAVRSRRTQLYAAGRPRPVAAPHA